MIIKVILGGNTPDDRNDNITKLGSIDEIWGGEPLYLIFDNNIPHNSTSMLITECYEVAG